MTNPDPVFTRLAELPALPPDPALGERLCARARSRLRPRRVHPAWSLAVALSVATYLGWAVHFSSSLY